MNLESFVQRYFTDAKRAGDSYKTRCPAHDDQTPSLVISMGNKGIVLHCHTGCDNQEILAKVGLTFRDLFESTERPPSVPIVRAWDIKNTSGQTIATHRRKDHTNGKGFWWETNGQTGLAGTKAKDLPLYGSENIPRFDKSRLVYLCEGEKDTDALRDIGAQAVGTVTGADSVPSTEVLKTMRGFSVALWPDNDDKGREHTRRCASILKNVAADLRILDVPALPPGGGAEDWVEQQKRAGLRTKEQLQEALATLPKKTALVEAPKEIRNEAAAKTKKANSGSHQPSDLGNCERFLALHREEVRYSVSRGWMVWDGKRWAPDLTGGIFRKAVETIRNIYQEAADTDDEKERKSLASHALRSEGERRIRAVVSLAQFQEGIAVTGQDFDKDPWLLNVANGTLDLRTGKLRPHRRADLITCLSPVSYQPEATCPTFITFLQRVMRGNENLISFLQRAAGYSLTGRTGEEVFFLCYGEGRNGKSKFLQALREIIGEDYAKVTNFKTFEASSLERANSPRGDLVSLRGKRVVTAIESKEGKQLAEEVIKGVTGNDPITARLLHKEEETFEPSFKLWLATNHKPVIKGTDIAIWERVLLIPWTVYIPPEERDLNLMEKFRAELPGILAWSVRGCLAWQKEGLTPPQEVKAAVKEYKEEMDELGDFLSTRCVLHPEAKAFAGELYNSYKSFCEAHSQKPISLLSFGRRLTARGLEKGKQEGNIRYLGIGIRTDRHNGAATIQ